MPIRREGHACLNKLSLWSFAVVNLLNSLISDLYWWWTIYLMWSKPINWARSAGIKYLNETVTLFFNMIWNFAFHGSRKLFYTCRTQSQKVADTEVNDTRTRALNFFPSSNEFFTNTPSWQCYYCQLYVPYICSFLHSLPQLVLANLKWDFKKCLRITSKGYTLNLRPQKTYII